MADKHGLMARVFAKRAAKHETSADGIYAKGQMPSESDRAPLQGQPNSDDAEAPDTPLERDADDVQSDDDRPSLREALNAEPLNGQDDGGEVDEAVGAQPDANDELFQAALSRDGGKGPLIQHVLAALAKKLKPKG